MRDVIVVGGGPAGAMVAEGISRMGFSVLIVEEHREIGRPIQCSGLVSPEVLKMAGSGERVVINPLRRATVFAGDEELTIESNSLRAVAIDRAMFDRELMRKALRSGAEIMLGTRATSFRKEKDGIFVGLRSGGEDVSVKTRLLIGADGASSIVSRSFGMDRPRELLGAFQAHISEEVDDVRIWPDTKSAFFTWQIPLKEGSLIGTAAPGPPSALDILRKKFPDFEKHSITHYGGAIPIGYSKNIVADRVALVGDAASQVKPLSGGGLYPGLNAANMLARWAVEALEKDDLSRQSLLSYQKAWASSVGKEIKNGMYIRKIYGGLSEEDMAKIIHELNNPDSKRIISEIGDIDKPSLLARPLVKSSPKLLVFARHLLGLLI